MDNNNNSRDLNQKSTINILKVITFNTTFGNL